MEACLGDFGSFKPFSFIIIVFFLKNFLTLTFGIFSVNVFSGRNNTRKKKHIRGAKDFFKKNFFLFIHLTLVQNAFVLFSLQNSLF